MFSLGEVLGITVIIVICGVITAIYCTAVFGPANER